MGDMGQNQLHSLSQPINQIGFRGSTGMNHIDQIQMNLLGSYNQPNAAAAAASAQTTAQQNYPAQNAFNGFSYSNQQAVAYPSAAAAAQLIQPNQISNVIIKSTCSFFTLLNRPSNSLASSISTRPILQAARPSTPICTRPMRRSVCLVRHF